MTLPRLTLFALLLWAGSASAQQGQPNLAFQHVTVRDGLSQNAVHSLVQDRHGYLWIATEDGLNRYDGYTFTVYRRQLADDLDTEALDPEALETAAQPQATEPHRVEHPGLSDSLVRVLYEDSAGILWIGTAGGVNRFVRSSGTFHHYQPWDQ